MMYRRWTRTLAGLLAMVLALTAAFALSGCSSSQGAGGDSATEPAEKPVEKPAEDEPEYTSYTVYINDDDSYSQGEITYSIALNLTATNPSAQIAGEYTGEATAKTDTVGTVQGQPLNASAIANSSQLSFTLEDGGGDLAALTTDTVVYGGTGTITMKASGSGTIGAAGGGFSNTSGQQFTMTVVGDAVTMKIPISGHTYTFTGTISGK